ncbi:MAG: Maf family nucleotide pyrophosphatase [Bacteroidia bacterium]
MNFTDFISGKMKVVLASQSLRRRQLLEEIGLKFELRIKDVDESCPARLECEDVVKYICEKKSDAFSNEELPEGFVLITADTIVWHEGQSLLKPTDEQDAINMLGKLSGKMHRVATGVCLRSAHKKKVFHVLTDVYFKPLSLEERQYYVKKYKPYDKSGSYGIQEWIGLIGIEKIVGSYTNVMGLPMKELYEELLAF